MTAGSGPVENATHGLTEFLLARISEDEANARSATSGDHTGNWWLEATEYGASEVSSLDVQGFIHAIPVDGEHIVRWDPARVLTECAAKRRVVDAHPLRTTTEYPEDVEHSDYVEGYETTYCAACLGDGERVEDPIPACVTLCAIAAVYSDHPDYQQEWDR